MADREGMRAFVASRTGDCRILVVGDVMLDKYYYGEVARISPEAPVPINRVVREKETLGGAANVAHNLALLGCRTSLAGFVGNDYHCKSLVDKLAARNISFRGLVHVDAPTTTKIRVIGGHQQMLRLDFEDTAPIASRFVDRLLNYLERSLWDGLDALILSDYGKGACSEHACRRIIELCAAHGVPVLVDPKGSDWQKYTGANCVTPNLKELNEILPRPIGNRDEEVAQAAGGVIREYGLQQLLVTRSECGLTWMSGDGCEHIRARAQEVFDVSGAGDTVIAVFALALAGGLLPADAAYLANLAAGVVVAKVGTYAVSKEELLAILQQ